MPFATTWMDLVVIIPSEVSQTETEKNIIWYHLYVESKIWHKWIYLQTEIDSQMHRTGLWSPRHRVGEGGVDGEFGIAAAAAAKSLQSCLTLCNSIDGNPPGSPVPGIVQARTLEWVAISFSNAGKWKVKVKSLSHFQPSATPWTAAYQAPPSMEFARQEYWSGVPLPSPLKGH